MAEEIKITDKLINDTLTYLATRPYREVAILISEWENTFKTEEPAKVPAPEELEKLKE